MVTLLVRVSDPCPKGCELNLSGKIYLPVGWSVGLWLVGLSVCLSVYQCDRFLAPKHILIIVYTDG